MTLKYEVTNGMRIKHNQSHINFDEFWEALLNRDESVDGKFFYGVKTTGIYCRPGCASRLPKRENVHFFLSSDDAEKAGFRACKRCQPSTEIQKYPHQTAIINACLYLDNAETQPSLEELAKSTGLSTFYFQRLFKNAVGVSPKQYYMQKRLERIRDNLQHHERISDAIYDSGYGSNSQFYTHAPDTLGMRPSQYKNGGIGMNITFTIIQSYLGWVLIAATELGICAIDFGDSPEILEEKLSQRFPNAIITKGDTNLSNWATSILSFLNSPTQDLSLPLDVIGTAFQRQVWSALKDIPLGSTASYIEIAQKIGKPKASRAVAKACASNPVAVVIPCHRVIHSNGSIGGYHWGVERKLKLLTSESESSESAVVKRNERLNKP